MAQLLHEGGPTMFWILMLVLPGLAFVVLHIVLHRGWTRWTALGVTALVLAIGLYGRGKGRAITDEALEGVDQVSDRELMRAEGYKEASRPLQLAGIVVAVFGVGIVIGELRRRRRS